MKYFNENFVFEGLKVVVVPEPTKKKKMVFLVIGTVYAYQTFLKKKKIKVIVRQCPDYKKIVQKG